MGICNFKAWEEDACQILFELWNIMLLIKQLEFFSSNCNKTWCYRVLQTSRLIYIYLWERMNCRNLGWYSVVAFVITFFSSFTSSVDLQPHILLGKIWHLETILNNYNQTVDVEAPFCKCCKYLPSLDHFTHLKYLAHCHR